MQIQDALDFIEARKSLSKYLSIPIGKKDNHKCMIDITKDGISLFHPNFKTPFMIMWSQYTKEELMSHHLIRACGLHKHNWCVVDITGGWGEDALKIAAIATSTLIIERNPLVYCMLKDALNRLTENQRGAIELLHAEALDWLAKPTFTPEVVYVDPMFPARHKRALVKKNMQILQSIVDKPSDNASLERLCRIALNVALKRVVIKRPRHGDIILPNPTFQIEGRLCRFDVYCLT